MFEDPINIGLVNRSVKAVIFCPNGPSVLEAKTNHIFNAHPQMRCAVFVRHSDVRDHILHHKSAIIALTKTVLAREHRVAFKQRVVMTHEMSIDEHVP